MIQTLQRILFALTASLILADLAWGLAGHFHVDWAAYFRIALLTLALLAGGRFYQRRRSEPRIAAMFDGAAFLCAFSAAASMLNYFLLTVHGPQIDAQLAAIDHRLGFDWPAAMAAMTLHPFANRVLQLAYESVLPQIALVMVALSLSGQVEKAYRFCLAVALGALLSIAVWTVFTACGTQALYTLAPQIAAKLHLAVEADYGTLLNRLLRGDPGYIKPSELRGLIAFPSYHGMLALIAAWYGRHLGPLLWPLIILNALVLFATPVQGGHHLIDVIASVPAAALVLWASDLRGRAVKARMMVNQTSRFTLRPIPQGLFRIIPEQCDDRSTAAIKRKLSEVS